ncbi:hypothetical protein [Streptomyces sp. NPDC054863]
MPTYDPMSFHLETERLILRPWAESDADELRVLHSERGKGTPTLEDIRTLIAERIEAAAATGIAPWNTASFRVLERLGFERRHVATDDRGEYVWLTRSLP